VAETLVLIMVYVVAAGFVVLAYRWPGAALITSLVVLVAVATFAAAMDYSGPGSFPLVIFLGPLVAVCLFRGSPDAGRWPHTTAKWILIVLGGLLAAGIGIGMSGLLSFVWAVIVVGAILRFILLSRGAVTHYVVSTISACMRQHMPLTSALAAAVAGRTDKRARMLGRICFMLSQGRPLSEAIRLGYRACPGHVVATVEAAERIDRLPQALRSLEADMLRDACERRRLKPFPFWYPLAVLVVVYMVVSATAIWIIPSYEMIFRGWGRPLPTATWNVLDAFRWLRALEPLAALAVLVGVPVGIYVAFRPRRADRFQLLARIGDFLKWHLPVGRWFAQNRSMLRTVTVLRLSLEAGCTLDQAIAATVALDVNCCFRWKLRRWLSRVQRGEDVPKAARAVGLGRPLAWAFDQRANPGSTPAALETLETICRSNYNYRARLARFVGWPMMIVALGGMVAFVLYAMYLPVFEVSRITMETVLP